MEVKRPQFDGVTSKPVTVVGVANGKAMVRDRVGNQFEIRLGLRPKGSGQPAPGEIWLVTKKGSMWAFDVMSSAPEPTVITGDRTGLHPVAAQILDALAAHGLVVDNTTGSDLVALDDTSDPSAATADMTESLVPNIDALPVTDDLTIDATYFSVGMDLSTTAGRNADEGGVRTGTTLVEETTPQVTDTFPLSIITYMQGNQIGPQRTRSDLVRLDKTRADIVAFQGADPSDRDSIYTGWDGWDIYRPAGHAATNTIAWRGAVFESEDQFSHPYTGTDGIDRCVNGVRLRHIASQTHLTVLDTQLEPWAAFGGSFLKTTGITNSVCTFNVNQFDSDAQVRADLIKRMQYVDVLMLQETVNFDLKAFAATQSGWSAYQVNPNQNDGKANTSILYRTVLGPPQATDIAFVGDAVDTRIRYLVAVKLAGVWYVSVHIFPDRDSTDIPAEIANIGTWADAHPAPQIWGLDKNQCSVSDLEAATNMTWQGIDIDGFLTKNGATVANLVAYPSGNSDHDGVRAEASSGDNKSPHVANFKTQMTQLISVVKAHQGTGPLFLCGNFNVDFRRDHRLRNPGLPYVALRGVKMHSNWERLGLGADAPVGQQTYYDSIYLDSRQRTATIEWQKVLRGYYGPHRPVLATYRLKSA